MNVIIKYINCDSNKMNHMMVVEFLKLLQKKFPLKNDVTIHFLGERHGTMTTGSRTPDNILKVLVKNRILRDVLRTVAHEWVHEYQIDVLNRELGPDIGGKNEDEANAYSGRLVKQFEKKSKYPKEVVYNPFN